MRFSVHTGSSAAPTATSPSTAIWRIPGRRTSRGVASTIAARSISAFGTAAQVRRSIPTCSRAGAQAQQLGMLRGLPANSFLAACRGGSRLLPPHGRTSPWLTTCWRRPATSSSSTWRCRSMTSPGGGGQLTYFNINPNKVARPGAVLGQLYNTLSDRYGDEHEHWTASTSASADGSGERAAVPGGSPPATRLRMTSPSSRRSLKMSDQRSCQRGGRRPRAHNWRRPPVLSPGRTVADQLQGARFLHASQGGCAARRHLPQRARPHEHRR